MRPVFFASLSLLSAPCRRFLPAVPPPAAESQQEAGDREFAGSGTGPPPLTTATQQQQPAGDARWQGQTKSENGGKTNAQGGGAGLNLDSRFSSWASFGSVTQEKPAKAGLSMSVWNESVAKVSTSFLFSGGGAGGRAGALW